MYQKNGKFDHEMLYNEMYKKAGRGLNGSECENKKYYLHSKLANPQNDKIFGVSIVMHKDSRIYKQWKKDENLAPEFTI